MRLELTGVQANLIRDLLDAHRVNLGGHLALLENAPELAYVRDEGELLIGNERHD